MNRRAFLFGSVATALALPFAAEAQQAGKAYRIGVLSNTKAAALTEALRELGWVEGQNLTIHWRLAQNDFDRYPALARELVDLKVDLIVAMAPPATRAAQHATKTIPIVMTAVADPLRDGFVASLARPGGNITGVASVAAPTLLPKILEIGRAAIPRMVRVGVLFNGANPLNYAATFSAELREAARALTLDLHQLEVRSAQDVQPAIESAAARVDAVLLVGDPLIFVHRERIQELAARHSLPTLQPAREYSAGRGLLSYGPRIDRLIRDLAPYVDKILKGAKPADLAVVQPSTYELVINLKTAKALGLTIPPSLLLRADQVIE